MARANAAEMADDGRAREVQVADGVEHLVAHELVRIAQPFLVENTVTADHNGVVQRSSPRQTRGPQFLNLIKEAEGARPSKLLLESSTNQIHRQRLTAHDGPAIVD